MSKSGEPTAEQHAAIKEAVTGTANKIRALAHEFGIVTESIDQEIKAAMNKVAALAALKQHAGDSALGHTSLDEYLGVKPRAMTMDSYLSGPTVTASFEAQLAAIDSHTKQYFIVRGNRRALDEAARLDATVRGIQEGKEVPQESADEGDLTGEEIDSLVQMLSAVGAFLTVIADNSNVMKPGQAIGSPAAEVIEKVYRLMVSLSLKHHLMAV
ncbi:hypothetical protein [Pandoraea terrae]|uniref:hypothetical protein n=1 Tax=Pandoraea terrae TaxID=1537710 RepID=UPI00123F1B73|nr:hypothetical protein [Pandoraea terrae]